MNKWDKVPTELYLNILEYDSSSNINVNTQSLIERIQRFNPSFSLSHILQDKMRQYKDKLEAMDNYYWNLYNILDRYEGLNIERGVIKNSILVITDKNIAEIIDESSSLYPSLKYEDDDNGIVIISDDDEDMMLQLRRIYYLVKSTLDVYSERITFYTNDLYVRYHDGRINRSLRYTHDNRSNDAILHDIHVLDPSYNLNTELNKAMALQKLKTYLYDHPLYPLYEQLKDESWSISINDNSADITVNSSKRIILPNTMNTKNVYDGNYSEITIYNYNKYPLQDIIRMSILDNPVNTIWIGDGIAPV